MFSEDKIYVFSSGMSHTMSLRNPIVAIVAEQVVILTLNIYKSRLQNAVWCLVAQPLHHKAKLGTFFVL